jgi:hypothetical protein
LQVQKLVTVFMSEKCEVLKFLVRTYFLGVASFSDHFRFLRRFRFLFCSEISTNVIIFQIVTVKNLTFNLEEEMLCKVLKFAGITRSDEELERIDETAYEAQHALIMSTTTAKRYYFGTLKLVLSQVISHLNVFKLVPNQVISHYYCN